MTASTAFAARGRPRVAGMRRATIMRLAARQVYRGAAVVWLVVAGMTTVVAATYASTVGGNAAALTALAANPAIRTLFGEPVALDTAGGFAVWRTGAGVGVLLAAWAILAVTRVTRGAEDAGRWDLLLAGRVSIRSVVGGHLAVIATATAVAGVLATTGLLLTGTAPGGALLHGAGVALVGMFFAAVGALTAQVFPSRGAATGAAIAVLGGAFAARMAGDGIDALGWLRWLSPFGLVALVQPYAADHGLPLIVLAAATVAVAAVALHAVGWRDIHDGVLAGRTTRRPRWVLLATVDGFAVRQTVRPLLGWTIGVGAFYLLIGVLVVSVTRFLTDNPRFADLAAGAGFAGLGSVEGFTAVLFALLAVPLGVFAATRIAALHADETARRLATVLSGPTTRWGLLRGVAASAVAGAITLAIVAGGAVWCGTTLVSAGLGLGSALAGALNGLPIAALCVGAAVLALGWFPSATVAVGAAPAAGGFLLLVIADSAGAPAWITNLSPFTHLAPVPLLPVNWPATLVMLAISAVVGAIGLIGFLRRDLHT